MCNSTKPIFTCQFFAYLFRSKSILSRTSFWVRVHGTAWFQFSQPWARSNMNILYSTQNPNLNHNSVNPTSIALETKANKPPHSSTSQLIWRGEEALCKREEREVIVLEIEVWDNTWLSHTAAPLRVHDCLCLVVIFSGHLLSIPSHAPFHAAQVLVYYCPVTRVKTVGSNIHGVELLQSPSSSSISKATFKRKKRINFFS